MESIYTLTSSDKIQMCDMQLDEFYESKIHSLFNVFRIKYINDTSILFEKDNVENSNSKTVLIIPPDLFEYSEYLYKFGLEWNLKKQYVSKFSLKHRKELLSKKYENLIALRSLLQNNPKNIAKIQSFKIKINDDPFIKEYYIQKVWNDYLYLSENDHSLTEKKCSISYIDSELEIVKEEIVKYQGRGKGKENSLLHLLSHNVLHRLSFLMKIDSFIMNNSLNDIDDIRLSLQQYDFIYDFLVFFNICSFTEKRDLFCSTRKINIIQSKIASFSCKCDFYIDIIKVKYSLISQRNNYSKFIFENKKIYNDN